MIKPFADDETTSSIGDLSIENGTVRVVLSGSVEITRDQNGLALAKELKRLSDGMVAELEAGPPLPTVATIDAPVVDQVANPFA